MLQIIHINAVGDVIFCRRLIQAQGYRGICLSVFQVRENQGMCWPSHRPPCLDGL